MPLTVLIALGDGRPVTGAGAVLIPIFAVVIIGLAIAAVFTGRRRR